MMKKIPAGRVWQMGDVEIFGYTVDELDRLELWKRENDERIIECPLIEQGVTKDRCFSLLMDAGIELPMMYRLGFRNNNCIGCVKARDSVDYWKRVRKHFPANFERVAKLEKELGYAINRVTRDGVKIRVPLYDLPEGDPTGPDPKISCGLFCMSEADDSMHQNVKVHPRARLNQLMKSDCRAYARRMARLVRLSSLSMESRLGQLQRGRNASHSEW